MLEVTKFTMRTSTEVMFMESEIKGKGFFEMCGCEHDSRKYTLQEQGMHSFLPSKEVMKFPKSR